MSPGCIHATSFGQAMCSCEAPVLLNVEPLLTPR